VKIVKKSSGGIEYLIALLKEKKTVFTRAVFWKIPHASGKGEDVSLKLGRYKKEDAWRETTLESTTPKSSLTLDNEELKALFEFISQNYEPFKDGVRKYIPLDESFDEKNLEHIRALFENPDKSKILELISKNKLLPEDLLLNLEHQKRIVAIEEFEKMLSQNLVEDSWQKWFKENQWVLGTEFVKVLDERDVDTEHITDYLMQAYDGFVDIIEIKRPDGGLKFWSSTLDRGNYIPSADLTKAITQSSRYIYEVEREANSVKFLERIGNVKTVKPRCVLVFGRSNDWGDEQKESYRILNASYHNITIMTYDHVLARAKRILGIDDNTTKVKADTFDTDAFFEDVNPDDIPF
jgi:hypothetical protein